MYVRVLKFFLNILLLVTNIRPEQDSDTVNQILLPDLNQ